MQAFAWELSCSHSAWSGQLRRSRVFEATWWGACAGRPAVDCQAPHCSPAATRHKVYYERTGGICVHSAAIMHAAGPRQRRPAAFDLIGRGGWRQLGHGGCERQGPRWCAHAGLGQGWWALAATCGRAGPRASPHRTVRQADTMRFTVNIRSRRAMKGRRQGRAARSVAGLRPALPRLVRPHTWGARASRGHRPPRLRRAACLTALALLSRARRASHIPVVIGGQDPARVRTQPARRGSLDGPAASRKAMGGGAPQSKRACSRRAVVAGAAFASQGGSVWVCGRAWEGPCCRTRARVRPCSRPAAPGAPPLGGASLPGSGSLVGRPRGRVRR
jgi:hypothetical protein